MAKSESINAETRQAELLTALPLTVEDWRALAVRLWKSGDERHAAFAHWRMQELESKQAETLKR